MRAGISCLLAVAFVSGCAAASGVVPMGGDTYMISKSQWGIQHTGSSVKANVIKEAHAYCSQLGRDLEVINTSEKDMVPYKSEAQAEVTFRCRPHNGG